MERSRNIAALMGPALVAFCIAMLTQRDQLPAMLDEIERGPTLILIAGLATFVLGLAVVRFHNVWKGWPIVVTLFGWLMIIGGLLRMFAVHSLVEFARPWISGPIVLGEITAFGLIGLFLTIMAYAPSRNPK
jgi:hypothetical protein